MYSCVNVLEVEYSLVTDVDGICLSVDESSMHISGELSEKEKKQFRR